MNKSMWKTTLREIRSSLGRYLAIFAIIALGVGFFSGLKVTKDAMIETADDFLSENNMFDFRLISTLGFDDEDIESLRKTEAVEYVSGAYHADAIVNNGDNEFVAAFHSIDDKINTPALKAGRLPEKSGELIADGRFYQESAIGTKITISDTNTDETLGHFSCTDYTIVGLAYSPLYLNYERGTTSVGNGSVSYFYLILPEDFSMPAYTDAYVTLLQKEPLFSKEYDDLIDSPESYGISAEERLEEKLSEVMEQKYEKLAALYGMMVPKPVTYVLTRNENIGYTCFKSDSEIVNGIAVVFPVFFFLVAALVCITTMSRMIEEQRTQIGVLKALGYSAPVIMAKYMIYSGSAALLGCVSGFFLGSWAFPFIIWKVYDLMYGFCDIHFVFSAPLFIISLIVALICSIGTTYISCKKDLFQVSAELIRPKAPKNGKRIFLEHITFLWKHIPFLHKVSLRNVFRYKGRFVMMLLGIGGCTGLLITGFGLSDSITGIADDQYTRILIYDESVNFSHTMTIGELNDFQSRYKEDIKSFMPVYRTSVDPVDTGSIRSTNLIVLAHEDGWTEVLDLHEKNGDKLKYPGPGEVILTHNVAGINNVEKGDTITFTDSDFNRITLKISGICDNYFDSYAYIDAKTFESGFNKDVPYKSAFINIPEGTDLHEAAAAFSNDGSVSAVSVNADTLKMFSKMMQAMDYIVILVTVCAAALAFIVLYNLTNINITERIREIATIKVLGFYANETASYVFRENLVLTALGAVLGIPVGIWLHNFVMSQIKIDMVTFNIHINGISFVYAMIFTFAFALFVDIVMYFKLARINMAESLKSIE